jgi:hypothetical protein
MTDLAELCSANGRQDMEEPGKSRVQADDAVSGNGLRSACLTTLVRMFGVLAAGAAVAAATVGVCASSAADPDVPQPAPCPAATTVTATATVTVVPPPMPTYRPPKLPSYPG